MFKRILFFFSISVDVSTTWDSLPLDHRPVRISIGREQNGTLPITVTGPLFKSPPAPTAPKGSLMGLWEFEGNDEIIIMTIIIINNFFFAVAEIFFLGEHGKYLEVEFGP